MRGARWQCALVACVIAACGVDPNESFQRSAVTNECSPKLLQRCGATDCGHFCSDDARAATPPGHLISSLTCQQTATTCSVTYTTCDQATGQDDPPPAPISFVCSNDHCGPVFQLPPCVASACGKDCRADLQAQVPSEWRITDAVCDPVDGTRCSEVATVCLIATGQSSGVSSLLSCPVPCGETRTPAPCVAPCGHDCTPDVQAKVPAGERIVGSGCEIFAGDTHCKAIVDTCDGNGGRHDYSAEFNDPNCGGGGDPCGGDPCCGDPCCGDPCCGDPCCGDPCCDDPFCCGDPCCGDPWCCGDPCCGDPCCGDECCGDPCCGDECCGDPCCEAGYGCWESLSSPAPGAPSAPTSPRAMGAARAMAAPPRGH